MYISKAKLRQAWGKPEFLVTINATSTYQVARLCRSVAVQINDGSVQIIMCQVQQTV